MSEPIVDTAPDRAAALISRLDAIEAGHATTQPVTLTPPPEVDISDLVPMTGNHPTETTQYRTVVLTDIPDHGTPLSLTALTEPVDLAKDMGLYTRPGEGVIITTQQEWHARGVTLGRLLHSLALAPGESTRVAVVDWTRQDAGRSSDDRTAREDLASTTDDARRSAESAAAAAKQAAEGSSRSNTRSHTHSAGASGGVSGFGYGIGGTTSTADNETMATTVARSASAKEATTVATQDIDARTRQEASAARTRQATVVKEANQVEGAKASTRVVTNYNHMHAMSVQYYEVVQSYDVRTYPQRIDRCVFVPMATLTFTSALLRRFTGPLAAAAPQEWADRMVASGAGTTTVTNTRASGASQMDRVPTVGTSGFVMETPPNSPALSQIAAAADGTVCAVTTAGRAVRWEPNGQSWVDLPPLPDASPVKHVAVGRTDEIWVVGVNTGVYHLTDGVFTQDTRAYMSMLTVCQDGSLWSIGSSNNATYHLGTDGWHDFGGAWGSQIAAADRNKIWHLGQEGQVYRGNSNADGWAGQIPDLPAPMKMIAASSDANLWAISTSNELYVRDSDTTPFHKPAFATEPALAKLLWVAPVSSEEVWAIRTDGRPVRISKPTGDSTLFSDTGDTPAALEVWSDAEVVRGLRMSFAGSAGKSVTAGDVGGGQRHVFTFSPNDVPTAIQLDTSPVEGGSLRRVVLRTDSSEVALGAPEDEHTLAGVPIPLNGGTICGLYGMTARADRGQFVAVLGFSVRTEEAPDDVLRHLNGNRDHYSRAVWANLDELTLSRMLASHTYTPSEPTAEGAAGAASPATNLPLGVCVDPRPVAMTGNYLAFRWNYPTETARREWLRRSGLREGPSADSPSSVVAVPSAGVFAEAVLGRANGAEKIDLTRFWNWGDSPIPILPPEIATVGLDSRARDLDLTSQEFDQSLAQLQQLRALPDPTGMDAVTKTMVTKLFDDMSKAGENAALALQSMKEAAASEKAAGGRSVDVYKAALEHYQATLPMMIDAAKTLLPLVAPQMGMASKVASVFGGDTPTAPRGLSPSSAPPPATDTVRLPTSAVASGSSVVDSLRNSLSGVVDPLLPGRTITETGGLINVATRDHTGNGDTATPKSVDRTGGGGIDALARQLVHEIGLPALRDALGQDPTLANLSSGRLSELLSTAIIDKLRGDVR